MAVSVTKGFDAEYLKREIAKQEAARQREAGREARREAAAREVGQPGAAARYYTAAAGQWEPSGRWIGKAAPRLGLTGEVKADVLDRVFVGQRAPDGTQLGRSRSNFTKAGQKALERAEERIAADPSLTEKQRNEIRYAELQKVPHAVAYYDYTFSVPKSVSVQWMAALSDAQAARDAGDVERAAALDAEADVIVKAVEAGNDAMIAFVEGRQYVRTGAHTATSGAYRDADGLTVASFTQFTSRDGDPQLHVHNAIANAAQAADGFDGQYRALAAEHLWKWKWVGDAIAQEVMRERLEDGLGLHMTLNADGTAYEFDGSPQDVRDAFSSRRVRITGELAPVVAEFERVYGRPPTRNQLHSMRQELAVRTRDAKPGREPDPGEMLARWAEKARAREVQVAGRVRESTQAAARSWNERVRVPGGVPDVPDAGTRSRCMQAGVAEVQRHHATWDEAQLWRAIWKFSHELPERGRIEAIDGMVADVLEGRAEGAEVVRLGPSVPRLDLSPLGVRTDGTPVHVRPMAERYCTPGQLALEDYLVAAAGRPAWQQITGERAAGLVAGCRLSDDQRAAVAGLLASQRAVDVLSGPAGTGKTTTMAAFCRTFREETGHRVIGVAASTTAAREMAAAGFDETYNAADFLGKIKGSDATRGHRELHTGEVIVADEAAATGNRDLAALMRAAQNRGARIILTGDTKQLDAPGQGGGMRLIEHAHGAHQLTEVHRFNEAWEGPASLRLRDGDTSVDAEYAGHGRTREGTQDEMRRQAVDGWLADHLAGKQALIVSSDNATAAELAAQARDRLIGLGRVADRADVVLGRDGNEASTGDLVIARANAKEIDAGGEPLANRHVLILDGWTGEGDRPGRHDAAAHRGRLDRAVHRPSQLPGEGRAARLCREHAHRAGPHGRHLLRDRDRCDGERVAVRRGDPRPRAEYAVHGDQPARPGGPARRARTGSGWERAAGDRHRRDGPAGGDGALRRRADRHRDDPRGAGRAAADAVPGGRAPRRHEGRERRPRLTGYFAAGSASMTTSVTRATMNGACCTSGCGSCSSPATTRPSCSLRRPGGTWKGPGRSRVYCTAASAGSNKTLRARPATDPGPGAAVSGRRASPPPGPGSS